jgi:murein DD-endopeptidase MepM/ murein hydrolase activator NlpD
MLLAAASCRQADLPRPALTEAPTHARYAAALAEFGLDQTALGQDWLRAADAALAGPLATGLPFRESGYLAPEAPTAIGYQFELRRGRRLVIDVTLETTEPTRLFIDLFELTEDREPRRVASTAPDERHLDYEARRDAVHVLRVQPELLRGGRFTITQRSLASLGFPVEGLSTRAILSVFGDPRDAGRRNHHGVDIFAPRGTPVLAAVDGRVRIGASDRGGNVVWLSPTSGARRRFYYAHLHGWAVENGTRVRAGQVLGYVGNTGNARTTRPHLHFGVYDRGPVDPYPYLVADDAQPPAVAGTLDLIRRWVRVAERDAPLRESPSPGAGILARLARGDVARVRAASGAFYRVELPDGAMGYVAVRQVTEAGRPLASTALAFATALRDRPQARAAVIDTLSPASTVDVLGRFGDFRLVRLADARTGWLLVNGDAQ